MATRSASRETSPVAHEFGGRAFIFPVSPTDLDPDDVEPTTAQASAPAAQQAPSDGRALIFLMSPADLYSDDGEPVRRMKKRRTQSDDVIANSGCVGAAVADEFADVLRMSIVAEELPSEDDVAAEERQHWEEVCCAYYKY